MAGAIPMGLAGEDLTLGGRIFAVADVFDAISSDRPYRAGMPRERVIEIITNGTGRQFDPKVVEAFLQVMGEDESEGTVNLTRAGTVKLTTSARGSSRDDRPRHLAYLGRYFAPWSQVVVRPTTARFSLAFSGVSGWVASGRLAPAQRGRKKSFC